MVAPTGVDPVTSRFSVHLGIALITPLGVVVRQNKEKQSRV